MVIYEYAEHKSTELRDRAQSTQKIYTAVAAKRIQVPRATKHQFFADKMCKLVLCRDGYVMLFPEKS